jgi:hypothetical protein
MIIDYTHIQPEYLSLVVSAHVGNIDAHVSTTDRSKWDKAADNMTYYAGAGLWADRPVSPENGTQYYATDRDFVAWYHSGHWYQASLSEVIQ